MKSILLTFAVFSMAVPAAADDSRSNVMTKFAEVIAIAGRCDGLTPNLKLMKLLAITYGIDIRRGTPDDDELIGIVADKRAAIADLSDKEICGMGTLAYGRNGMNMENMLLEK